MFLCLFGWGNYFISNITCLFYLSLILYHPALFYISGFVRCKPILSFRLSHRSIYDLLVYWLWLLFHFYDRFILLFFYFCKLFRQSISCSSQSVNPSFCFNINSLFVFLFRHKQSFS